IEDEEEVSAVLVCSCVVGSVVTGGGGGLCGGDGEWHGIDGEWQW
ncbi:hypothetical protein Tco_0552514, partial [Tanacetum coccineum]